MRRFNIRQSIGSPIVRRSGATVFVAVVVVLVVGSAAMAANLGLWTVATPQEADYELYGRPPRPVLTVSIPLADPSPVSPVSDSGPLNESNESNESNEDHDHPGAVGHDTIEPEQVHDGDHGGSVGAWSNDLRGGSEVGDGDDSRRAPRDGHDRDSPKVHDGDDGRPSGIEQDVCDDDDCGDNRSIGDRHRGDGRSDDGGRDDD